MEDLHGKVVLLTGAGRGMGAAMARLFAQRGARVVLGARSVTELAGLVAEIEASGGRLPISIPM